jgi:hypothetical protein
MFESPLARRFVLAASLLFSGCAGLPQVNRSDCMESSEFRSFLISWRTYDGLNQDCKTQKNREAMVENLTLFANTKRADGSPDLAAAAVAFKVAVQAKDPELLKLVEKEAWFQTQKLKEEASCKDGVPQKNADGSVTTVFDCVPTTP